jgi:hypothetical protein
MKGRSARIKSLAGIAVLAFVLLVCTASVAGAATASATGHCRHSTSAQTDQYCTKPVVPPHTAAAVSTGGTAPAQSGGTLPFTGLSLVGVVVAGVALILLGAVLRWRRSPHKDSA